MQRYALGLEYEGSSFHGWQSQKGVSTVEDTLNAAIAEIVQHPVDVVAAGRTDAGVHGLGQVVHFDTEAVRPIDAYVRGVNTHLPKTIRIRWAAPVADDFHARYSATERRYIYLIHSDKISPGLLGNGVTWVHYPLDIENMRIASKALIGEHDFSSFRAADCQSNTPIRDIRKLDIYQQDKLIVVDISANAFLHHMVRNIVGLLLAVGRGQFPATYAQEVLEFKNRSLAPQMASANGLYLLHVDYPEAFMLPGSINLPWYISRIT